MNFRNKNCRYRPDFALFLIAAGLINSNVSAIEFEGYVEPYRTIRIAADESGTVEKLFVREGQRVEAQQPLAQLNSDVLKALLAVAQQSMNATGRVDAAEAELHLRKHRLEKLRILREEGHARQEEVERAEAEFSTAEAHLRSAMEDRVNKQLQYEKIKTQLARRTIRAPLAGVLTATHKQPGEFVSSTSPDVATLVQIDTLLATFTTESAQIVKLRVGQQLKVRLLDSQLEAAGVVEFISPVNDAESGAVEVKVRIDNREGRFRSGERCTVHVGD